MIKTLAGALLAATLLLPDARAACEDGHLDAATARADLDALYDGLRAAHADLFAATPRAVFEARHDELARDLDGPVSCAALHARLQRFTALAGHAHAHLSGLNPDWAPFAASDGAVFPLDFRIHEGEVIVTLVPADGPVRPGDRIVALDGEANPIWLRRLTRNLSADTPALAYAQMEGGALYFIWLEYGPRDHFALTIERDGQRFETTVDALPLSALDTRTGPTPGFRLDGREARMLTTDIAYLRPGPFFNIAAETPEAYWDPQARTAFLDFIDTAFQDALAAGATDLILDLRDNPGGDNSWSDPIVAWFADEPFRFASAFRVRVSEQARAANEARLEAIGDPDGHGDSISARYAALYASAAPGEMVDFQIDAVQPRPGPRFDGRVHVLINRHSFSNAVTTAALIQDYGFGTLYGEATTDMATTYGAMEHFTLPGTGWQVGFPKAHIIRPNGETAPHPVTPDIALDIPLERGETDTVLAELVARIEASDARPR